MHSASNGSRPLVSVALCTYNGAQFIERQLDSLLQQSWSNIEIVAVDDGSTDATVSILDRYSARDSRIRVSVNTLNVGFMQNFARAMSLTAGEFIAPCDQDDVWLPGKIEKLLESIGDHSLAYCDSMLVDEQGASMYPMSRIVPMRSTDDPAPFAFGNCVSGHAMLFRRELISRALPIPEAFFHDWWIAAIAAAAGGIVFCDEALVLYRQHGANVTDRRMGEMIQEAGLAELQSRAIAGEPSARGEPAHLRETAQRLAALAQLPGKHQPFIARLHALWAAREDQLWSPRLALTMLSNRRRLFALSTLPPRKQRRYCRKLLRGARLQRARR